MKQHKFSIKNFLAAIFLLAIAGCQKNDDVVSSASNNPDYAQRFPVNADYSVTNLVADVQEEYDPLRVDPILVNAWGMAFSTFGTVWVSANETHVSTVYDKDGNTVLAPVAIPFETDGGNVTGQVFNNTSAFIIPATSQVSKFIFVTENGTITAWASGPTSFTVANRSDAEAVYKGVEMVNSNGQWFLYAADFHNAKIDIFDQNFNFVGNSMFNDATIPAGYAPFNIRKIDDRIYVTYAKQLAPENHDDEAGPGNGYVNIFNLDGTFVQRFASQGMLNSPWRIEKGRPNNGASPQSQNNPGATASTTILIGNFGDGHINAFDADGNFLGQLMRGGQPLEIEGLWSISYPPQIAVFNDVRNWLYFTAGPDGEDHGVFGFISK